jgi:uncharacterized protein YjaG (DUF416 family)
VPVLDQSILAWPSDAVLARLSKWQDAAFGLAIAERSFPNYELFIETSGFGETQLARQLLNKGWSFISGEARSLKNLEGSLERFDACIPHAKDFDQYGVYPAMDAAVAIQSSIIAIIDPLYRCAIDLSQLSRSTLSSFLNIIEADEDSAQYYRSREQDFQQQTQQILIAMPEPEPKALAALRLIAQDEGVSQIGIQIETD